jgi:hypothetical protein
VFSGKLNGSLAGKTLEGGSVMRSLWSLCSLTLIVAVIAQVGAQEPAQPPKKEELSGNAAKAAEFAAAEAVRYDIRHADEGKKALKLLPKPVLRWSNSLRGEIHGSVYLWTKDGCPEATASIYQFFHKPQLNIELVSLSEVPLKAERNGRVRWSPEAGLKFAALPGGPESAATADARQLQMRALARKFAGYLAEPGEKDDKFTELRLMAAPLHRYEATDGSGREGAVFALVTTTDPEILLLVESRKGANGREWVWAAARMHFRPLQLKLADKVVWDVPAAAPPWDKIRGPEGKYVILEWATAEAAAKD